MIVKNILNHITNKPVFNKVQDNIWVGNEELAKNPKLYADIDVVINCSKGIKFYDDTKINHRISVSDDSEIDNIKNLETYLEMSADIIKHHIDENKKILIFCSTSINLTPSILAAFMIKHDNKTLYNACEIIVNKHPLAFIIKPTFRLSLINYEYNILKKNSHNIAYIHFKVYKVFWILLILPIIIIIYKLFNRKSSKSGKKNRLLEVEPKQLIYDFRTNV